MKRALILLVGGALILGSALPALAQAQPEKKPLQVPGLTPEQNQQLERVLTPPAVNVTFGGQMRVYGFTTNNTIDFKDSENGLNRDSAAYFFQRFRLFTTMESADKKAKAYWALEIGDITWGNGGGANAGSTVGCNGQFPTINPTVTVPPPAGSPPGTLPTVATVTPGTAGAGNRVGNGAGGCIGADGVNVETKNIWLWLDTGGWLPGTSVLMGIGNIVFMNGPLGAFADDDAATIQLNWKSDMVDVQGWLAKLGEGNINNADDTDAYAIRVGVNITKDIRVTLEGLLLDEKLIAGQNLGDTFWIGATVGAKIGDISIDGQFVYGQRAIQPGVGATCGTTCEESGFGVFVLARVPVGPVNVNALGWYTTGDANRTPGSGSGSSTRLTQDSDKLPIPWSGGSWFNGGGAYMGEFLLGLSTTGNASGNPPPTFGDPTGTFGVGASATYAITPALSVGGGVAYMGASDSDSPAWGSGVIEIDAGLTYRFNPNVTMNVFGGYMIPDQGDSAWGLVWRTVYAF